MLTKITVFNSIFSAVRYLQFYHRCVASSFLYMDIFQIRYRQMRATILQVLTELDFYANPVDLVLFAIHSAYLSHHTIAFMNIIKQNFASHQASIVYQQFQIIKINSCSSVDAEKRNICAPIELKCIDRLRKMQKHVSDIEKTRLRKILCIKKPFKTNVKE